MTTYLDFNEPPLGAPPAAVRATLTHAAELHRYPRGLHERTVEEVAVRFGVEPGMVLVTAGVDEAMDVLLQHARGGCCFTPGFTGYRHRAAALGLPLLQLPLDEAWAPPRVGGWAADNGVVIVTQPNNPTGNFYPARWLEELIERAPLVCIDETFVEFSSRPSFLPEIERTGNVCVFKSFSKAFGVAGLRVGALFGPEPLMRVLGAGARFYSVDAVSLHALVPALDDQDFRRRTVEYVRHWRGSYAQALRDRPELFGRVEETEGNFVLAQCEPSESSARFIEALAANGVRVADCAVMGLAGWVRVTVGEPGSLGELVRALARVSDARAEAAVVRP